VYSHYYSLTFDDTTTAIAICAQTARHMGAVVKAFDVRAAVKEQVHSLGGEFIEVQTKEEGSGAGGYAKEMSPEWFAQAARVLAHEVSNAMNNLYLTSVLFADCWPSPSMVLVGLFTPWRALLRYVWLRLRACAVAV
jgi:Alanine dehydrogenase/PNT, C-terminal domain